MKLFIRARKSVVCRASCVYCFLQVPTNGLSTSESVLIVGEVRKSSDSWISKALPPASTTKSVCWVTTNGLSDVAQFKSPSASPVALFQVRFIVPRPPKLTL
jgi:hypothetical protein